MHHKLFLSFVLHGERQCTINNLLSSFELHGERQAKPRAKSSGQRCGHFFLPLLCVYVAAS